MATRLGDMAVGSTVKTKVDGTLRDFIIVQQGNPNTGIYDASCDGTWVLMNDIYENREWNDRASNSYAYSTIQAYLNSTFLNLFESVIKDAIKQVKIPYWKGVGTSGHLSTGLGGFPTKVFLLSATETSFNVGTMPRGEGAELAYFNGCSDDSADSKRIAYLNGTAVFWWLRTPALDADYGIIGISSSGGPANHIYDNPSGVRPAFILPSTLLVSDNGTLNVSPTITTDAADLGEQNEPFTVDYTVTDDNDDLMTVTEKLDGEVKQTRTEVPSETALTVDWLKGKAGYQQVLNGSHTLTIEASDGVLTATKSITFTKNVTRAVLSLAQPLTADDTITVAALTLEGSFPADMSLTVEMTNNALDDSPVWETVTDIQRGESRAFVHHAFTNKTAARGFAFNYKVTIARGKSGTEGNLIMIGGVIG